MSNEVKNENITKFIEFQKDRDKKFELLCSIIISWAIKHDLKIRTVKFRNYWG